MENNNYLIFELPDKHHSNYGKREAWHIDYDFDDGFVSSNQYPQPKLAFAKFSVPELKHKTQIFDLIEKYVNKGFRSVILEWDVSEHDKRYEGFGLIKLLDSTGSSYFYPAFQFSTENTVISSVYNQHSIDNKSIIVMASGLNVDGQHLQNFLATFSNFTGLENIAFDGNEIKRFTDHNQNIADYITRNNALNKGLASAYVIMTGLDGSNYQRREAIISSHETL